MSSENRLKVARILDAYEKTGFAPVYGLFFAKREGGQAYACPVCAVVKAEHGKILGPRGKAKSDDEAKGVAYAAQLLGLSVEYVKSFMTAYDGLRYDLFESSDDKGVKDGEIARRMFPPEWGR